MVVGTRAAVTHDRYLHDRLCGKVGGFLELSVYLLNLFWWYGVCNSWGVCYAMIGENQQLVTNEPVEFEK